MIHPGFKAVTLIVFSAVPVTVIGLLLQYHPFSYFAYLYTAYALVLFCANISPLVRHISTLIKGDRIGAVVKVRQLMERYEFTSRYLHDKDYRATVAIYSGQLINLLYAAYKVSAGIYYDSSWLWTGGIYYAVIFAIRFCLANDHRKIPENTDNRYADELRAYRKCGALLLILSLAMSGMTIQMTVNNKHYSFSNTIIIMTALFTFIYFFTAVGKLVSYSKRSSPILKASKNISMIAAAMSMFSLQTAMIPAFGNDETYRSRMNIITGTVVMIFSVGMAAYMLISSYIRLKRIHRNNKSSV